MPANSNSVDTNALIYARIIRVYNYVSTRVILFKCIDIKVIMLHKYVKNILATSKKLPNVQSKPSVRASVPLAYHAY